MSLASILNGSQSGPSLPTPGGMPSIGRRKRSKASGLGQRSPLARGAVDLLSRPSRPHRKGYKQTSDLGSLLSAIQPTV